jgi:hypothetical protein
LAPAIWWLAATFLRAAKAGIAQVICPTTGKIIAVVIPGQPQRVRANALPGMTTPP